MTKYDPAKKAKEVGKWVPKSRDEILRMYDRRYEYDLDNSSLVFDFGGYDGKWAHKLNEMHGCKIYSFEPVPSLYKGCADTLKDVQDVTVFEFGLAPSHEDSTVQISVEGDASSMFSNNTGSHNGKNTETCILKSFSNFIDEHNIESIDLVKMNIEGAEFDLLDFILDNSYHKFMKNIQIQFHEFMDDCVNRRNSIRERLSETHNSSWEYPWVLESWCIK